MSRILKAPDGRKYRIPDDATQEQIDDFIAKNAEGDSIRSSYEKRKLQLKAEGSTTLDRAMARQEANEAAGRATIPTVNQNPTKGMSDAYLGVAGYGKAVPDMAMGAGQLVGLADAEDVKERRRLDAPLMETTAGAVGNFAGNVAAAVPFSIGPAAATVPGSAALGGLYGALQPTEQGAAGKIQNAAVGAVANAAITGGMNKISNALTNEAKALSLKRSQDALKNQTLKEAQEMGMVVPPAQANPTMMNRILEGYAGKITTSQGAKIKNQEIVNQAAKTELGIHPAIPVERDELMAIRQNAGRAYDTLKNVGTLTADPQYQAALENIQRQEAVIAKNFPGLANQGVLNLTQQLSAPQFSAESAVELMKRLKFDGNQNRFNMDPATKALGKAQVAAAEALENLFDRTLTAKGDKTTLNAFRQARIQIAKSYTVEKALNPATGNINAQVWAREQRKGKPLSGDIEKVASFANAFPDAVGEYRGSAPGVSPLDFAAAGGIAAAAQNPSLLATIAGRPIMRSVILSKPYQAAMTTPSYTLGVIGQTAKAATGPFSQSVAKSMALPSLMNILKNAPESD